MHREVMQMKMGSTLNFLYDYVQDFELLIKKTEELAKKSTLKNQLLEARMLENTNFLSIIGTEHLVSLSRSLVDYGFSQTYESFRNACQLLLADYNRIKEAVDTALERLKESASLLYADKDEADFLWKARKVSDPWTLLMSILIGSDDEAVARRKFYLRRIAELANLSSLANIASFDESSRVAADISPLQLEMDFITSDGILPEILSLHANKTDLH